MLEGKVALITGAAKGIGRAIALAMAAEKATVVINYNGSKERAEQVLEEVKALGADGCVYQCNVADTADTDAMIKEIIKTYGHLDILVNNAGITRDNLIMKMSEEDFDAVINANLKGCFNTIKAVSRQMLRQRSGRIINITSVSGILGNAGHTAHIFRNGHVVVIENNNKIPFQTGSIVQRLISHAASQRTISDYGYHMLVTVLQISGCHQTDPCRDRSRAVSRIKTVTVTFLSLGETTHTAIFPKLVKS